MKLSHFNSHYKYPRPILQSFHLPSDNFPMWAYWPSLERPSASFLIYGQTFLRTEVNGWPKTPCKWASCTSLSSSLSLHLAIWASLEEVGPTFESHIDLLGLEALLEIFTVVELCPWLQLFVTQAPRTKWEESSEAAVEFQSLFTAWSSVVECGSIPRTTERKKKKRQEKRRKSLL